MVKYSLLGVRKFTSKEGKNYAVLQLQKPFSQRELDSGSVGMAVEEKFVPENLYHVLPDLLVNKPVEFDYDVVGTKAYIVGIRTVAEKK